MTFSATHDNLPVQAAKFAHVQPANSSSFWAAPREDIDGTHRDQLLCVAVALASAAGVFAQDAYRSANEPEPPAESPYRSPSELKKLPLEELVDVEITSASRRPEPLSHAASAAGIIRDKLELHRQVVDVLSLLQQHHAELLRWRRGQEESARLDGSYRH